MKIKKVTVYIFVSIVVLTFLSCKQKEVKPDESSIKWYNYNKGIKIAKNEKKIVLVDFYASWCKWCHVMEKEIFSDAEMMKKLNKDFICVRLYMDSPSTGIINYKGNQFSNQQFSMVMRVSGLPTLLFIDNDEEVITVVPGYTQKPLFSTILDYILDYRKKDCSKKKVNFNDFVSGKEKCEV